ncbi:MAG: hypothetical protein R2792_15160 [Saprospiraceae bacterium]
MKKIASTLLGILALCVNMNAQKTTANSDWQVISSDAYSIQCPPDWNVDRSGQMGTELLLTSTALDSQDVFTENVNLLVQDLNGYEMTLKEFVELSESQVLAILKDPKILFSEEQKDGPEPYHKIIYTGNFGALDLHFEQYYWVQETKAYVLTFTCAADQAEAHQELGEKILDSFELK